MDKKEIAKAIGKDISTLYNWEKRNPILYEAVYHFFNKDEATLENEKLLELFNKLNNTEQKFYIADMERRVLKKELEQEQGEKNV